MKYYSNSAKSLFNDVDLKNTNSTSKSSNLRNSLTLDDVSSLLYNQGVVGEESLIKQLTCALVNRSQVALEGRSGTGKTFIMDKLLDLFPNVYALNQTTSTAAFYDADKINSSNFMYIPELQKVLLGSKKHLLELIKDVSEGKNSTRLKTSYSKNETVEQKINGSLSIVYTLATENDYKPDKELQRRFLHFRTDDSNNHLEDILASKAEARSRPLFNSAKEEMDKSKIKTHLGSCLKNNYKIVDPFSNGIFKQFIGKHDAFTEVAKYSSLVDGLVKFNSDSHVKYDLAGETYLITNIDDHLLMADLTKNSLNINIDLLDGAKKSVKALSDAVFEDWLLKQLL